jgi:AraC family transcriptional regulator of adaptative response/methylated-DNA-[protein]-cysteine methyltransferase
VNTTTDPRWQSIVARDAAAGFYYSVKTTGVYCLPSCAARLPRPENVAFHATCDDAERAGFRPCKRCKPREAPRNTALVAEACRVIDTSEVEPSLGDLAAKAGLSPFHFQRVFKKAMGVSPKQYAKARRAARVRSSLAAGTAVTDAVFEAGFQSNSRFYENADAMLGMRPRAYRAGGAREEIRYAVTSCSLGHVLAAESDRGICAILLGGDEADLRRLFPRASIAPAGGEFAASLRAVAALVEEPRGVIGLPLDIRGTAFQQRVWTALRQIPAGRTASYSDVAKAIGAPQSVRAVARACASNVLAVAIPCHRVVRGDGALSGYRWGVERKQALLQREKSR